MKFDLKFERGLKPWKNLNEGTKNPNFKIGDQTHKKNRGMKSIIKPKI